MKLQREINLLKKLEILGGKVKYTHNSVYDGRKQTVALMKIAGKYYQGYAQLSDKDKFSRKMGRLISLGRAFKQYEKDGKEDEQGNIQHTSIIPDQQWMFTEDRDDNDKK